MVRIILAFLCLAISVMGVGIGLPSIAYGGQIGDFAWYDLNRNGLQDAGEPGAPGVTVKLYSGSAGTILESIVVTNEAGYYTFIGLFPGDYYIEFIPPPGAAFTNPNVGTNDQVDSDAILHGIIGPITLDNTFSINNTIDAGIKKTVVPLTGTLLLLDELPPKN
jgi:SdrD B-like domain